MKECRIRACETPANDDAPYGLCRLCMRNVNYWEPRASHEITEHRRRAVMAVNRMRFLQEDYVEKRTKEEKKQTRKQLLKEKELRV